MSETGDWSPDFSVKINKLSRGKALVPEGRRDRAPSGLSFRHRDRFPGLKSPEVRGYLPLSLQDRNVALNDHIFAADVMALRH